MSCWSLVLTFLWMILLIQQLYDYYLPCPFFVILFHRRTESHIIIKGWHVHWRAYIYFVVFNIVLIGTIKMLWTITQFVKNFTPLWFMMINHDMHYLYAQPNMIFQKWLVEWISSLERKPHCCVLKISPIFIICLFYQISYMGSVVFQTTTVTDLDLGCICEIAKYNKLTFRFIH